MERTRVKASKPATGAATTLHTLDQILPIYITLNLFYNPAPAQQHVISSLSRTLDAYPFVGGSLRAASLDDGRKELHLVDDGRGIDFIWEERTSMRFNEVVGGDSMDFMPRGLMGTGESDQSLLMIKCTKFSCGTLVLGLSASHHLCDCTSYTTFVKEFARQSRTVLPEAETPSILSTAHRPDKFFPPFPAGEKPKAPHGMFMPTGPPSPPPPPAPSSQVSFLLTKESMRELKAAATPSQPGAWISTGDAISALFWRTISRARFEKIEANEVHMGLAVDGRTRSKDPAAAHYFGNLVTPATITLPKTVLLAEGTIDGEPALSVVALAVRQSIESQLTEDKVADMIAFLDAVKCIPFVADPTRGDTRFTNWTKYDFLGDDYALGSELVVGQPEPVPVKPFKVSAGAEPSPCGQILLVNHQQGFVVSFCVEPEWVGRIAEDKEFTKYATVIDV